MSVKSSPLRSPSPTHSCSDAGASCPAQSCTQQTRAASGRRKIGRRRNRAIAAVAAALLLALALGIDAARADAPGPARVGVDEQIGTQLPLATVLRDSRGQRRALGTWFNDDKPVVLNLSYFHCTTLCDTALRELAKRLAELGFSMGRDYRVLTFSIDPRDAGPIAAKKRDAALQLAGVPHTSAQWPFLMGSAPDIAAITGALGYRYAYDGKTDQYAHPAVLVVLTPEGRIARYLYGVKPELADLRLALREARLGRGGRSSLADRVLLTCFRYDPATRRYEPMILGVMRGGSLLFALALAAAVAVFARRGRALREASRGQP